MTKVVFYGDSEKISGFCITGHSTSNENDDTGRLVCSAVSSAAYMTANTVTEIIGLHADVEVTDARMSFKVNSFNSAADSVLRGFKFHMEQLAEQYENNIMISSEV